MVVLKTQQINLSRGKMKKRKIRSLYLLAFLTCIMSNLTLLHCEVTDDANKRDCRCTEQFDLSPDNQQENSKVVPCGKRYIAADKISFSENTILIEIDDMVLPTPAIQSDEGGFYIQYVKVNSSRCDGMLDWECGRCGYCNIVFDKCCLVCNRDKRGRECK